MFVSSKIIPLAKYFLSFLLLFSLNKAFAQSDSLANLSDTLIAFPVDSVKGKEIAKPKKPKTGVFRQALYLEPLTLENKPGAVFIRSVVPGLGQITNGQNWKAPIVWAAAAGGIGTIRYWGSRFKGYRDEILASGVNATSTTFRPAKGLFDGGLNIGFTENLDAEQITIDNTRFKTVIERFRRFRDLSVIGFSVGYLIVGVEAYVSAHLKNFDVSDDISLQIKPMVQPNLAFGTTFGATAQLNFK